MNQNAFRRSELPETGNGGSLAASDWLNGPEGDNFFLPGILLAVERIRRSFLNRPDCGRETAYLQTVLEALDRPRQTTREKEKGSQGIPSRNRSRASSTVCR